MGQGVLDSVDVAVVGGGASGVLVALHLASSARVPLKVALFEKAGPPGRGIAYGTPSSCHLLNVPAGRMSALPQDPQHFLHWLQNEGHPVTAQSFVPRHLYGRYLEASLEKAMASGLVQTQTFRTEVRALSRMENGFALRTVRGALIAARAAVLCLGNLFPEQMPIPVPSEVQDHCVVSPWSPGALAKVPPEAAVLLLGTGLTMVDVALALVANGHRGPLHAVSRHGLTPMPHARTPHTGPSTPLDANPLSARSLLRALREASRADGEWRHHLDALRPVTSSLWASWPAVEQRRFLRHLRAYWEVHRHRMAPAIADSLSGLLSSGQLRISAGRAQALRWERGQIHGLLSLRGEQRSTPFQVDTVINCTGPCSRLLESPSRLVHQGLEAGWARPDALGMGMDTSRNGEVIGSDGEPAQNLFAVGALRRGTLWESTAIPELREQAAQVARQLLERVLPEHKEAAV
jgi:uncharacterized NAD(P)/FAD-binding protein YdhS